MSDGIRSITPFDPDQDPNCVGKAWAAWKRNYEYWAATKNFKQMKQKVSALLYSAGDKVQKLYLQEREDEEFAESDETIESVFKVLDTLFGKQQNDTLQRQLFRRIKQEPGEHIMMFVTKLKEQLKWCKVVSQAEEEAMIRDQVIEHASNKKLAYRIIEKGTVTIDEIIKMGQALENSEAVIKNFGSAKEESINSVKLETSTRKHGESNVNSYPNRSGFQRNQFNHRQQSRGNASPYAYQKLSYGTNKPEHEIEYIMSIEGGTSTDIVCTIGGVSVEMLIDSGTRCNLIPLSTWNLLKRNKVTVLEQIKGSDVKLKAFGQEEEIPILGRFRANIKLNNKEATLWFYISTSGNRCLLGREAAVALEVLYIGTLANQDSSTKESAEVNSISTELKFVEISNDW